jgi:VanZ family protein
MHRILRVAVIVFLLLLVVFAEFHEQTRIAHTLQKLAHPVTFGAIALLVLMLLPAEKPRPFGIYVAAFLLTVLGGASTELAQAFVHRDSSLLDVLRDALGASTALAGFATIVPGADARGRGRRRVLGVLATCAGIVTILTPIAIALAAYANRDTRFPTLLEACSPLDRYFVRGGGADVQVVPSAVNAASSCGKSLRVRFTDTPYAGIHLEEPYPDWRGLGALVLDLRNPGEADLPISIRVHDRAHNNLFRDRFNRDFMLPAREALEIAIPITDIEHGPADRLIDLAQIAEVIVFRNRGTLVGSFEVERILLRR